VASSDHPQLEKFLALMQSQDHRPLSQKKILDCGAGGSHPPLILFAQQGLHAFGIDLSAPRLEMAQQTAQQQGVSLTLRQGDMRALPFEDHSFDFVYEFYSMCHLRKRDILLTIEEMMRVVKPGGLIFLGFMIADSWPLTGRPNEYNEWVLMEDGAQTLHSVFFDEETYEFVEGLKVLFTEQERRSLADEYQTMTLDDWMAQHQEDWFYERDEWEAMYAERLAEANSSHRFFVLQKQG
jgi:ubiquinone/menaquinone biosynthesis C-methylase UbiE